MSDTETTEIKEARYVCEKHAGFMLHLTRMHRFENHELVVTDSDEIAEIDAVLKDPKNRMIAAKIHKLDKEAASKLVESLIAANLSIGGAVQGGITSESAVHTAATALENNSDFAALDGPAQQKVRDDLAAQDLITSSPVNAAPAAVPAPATNLLNLK